MIVAPIGGGGLISGISVAVKAKRPAIEVIGVQTAACPSMYAAIKGTSPTGAETTIADGIAVKAAGTLTRKLIADLVTDIFWFRKSKSKELFCFFWKSKKQLPRAPVLRHWRPFWLILNILPVAASRWWCPVRTLIPGCSPASY